MSGFRLTLTGLEGPKGRPSRADMGAAARRALPFPTTGAWYGGLQPHGPTQWLEAAPPASVQTHERMRLFAPVDVMPGQTGMEL